jgi:hypothetical protein
MEPIQPEASIASTGKSIRYIGTDPMHCYAYSGLIPVQSSQGEVTLLEDTSGSGFIVGDYQFFYAVSASNEFIYRMYFNGVIGMAYWVQNFRESTPDEKTGVIIPPFTKIKLTAENLSSDSGRNQAATLIGRVYGTA